MITAAAKKGHITQVIGSTFDVEFDGEHLPDIYNAVTIKAENKGATIAEGDFQVQNGKDNFSVTGTGTTSPDCSPPMTLVYSNVVVTVSGDSFDPDLVFAFSGTF